MKVIIANWIPDDHPQDQEPIPIGIIKDSQLEKHLEQFFNGMEYEVNYYDLETFQEDYFVIDANALMGKTIEFDSKFFGDIFTHRITR